jgi:nucleoside-diphosphate-sugar epimerase
LANENAGIISTLRQEMENQQRNVWIFGCTGFIGQELLTHLSSDPGNRLHLLLHRRVDFRRYESFNTFVGSLEDFDSRLFDRYPPDVIFHLARFAGGRTLTRKIASIRAFNANRRLIGLIEKLAKPPLLVYVSGSLMYGTQYNNRPATENTALSPAAYAKYYIRGEQPWLKAQQEGKLDIRFARPGWIVGHASWFVEFYWKYYLRTGKVPSYGDGTQYMSLVSLKDCARLIDLLSREGSERQNLNILMAPPVRQTDFSAALAKQLNTSVDEIHVKDIRMKYGKTVESALTTSIPMATDYPDIYKKFKPLHPNLDSILEQALTVLKNE